MADDCKMLMCLGSTDLLKKLLRDEVANSAEQTDLEKRHPSSGSVCLQRKVGSSKDLSGMKSIESVDDECL
ncbi:hypothetical protein N7537_007302 [Penicillium hordei]|uniref:Uncharacterized protein n=1 Tax=Penicillium hordei TaxID=40994 RepID=A0AAD6DY65_9EURO|nr:uncharacterized protein N7537_007302 [Penicillium hordei]KAJ5597218.1 hypothetical protein N7537_007302 [Penicillium hordei]